MEEREIKEKIESGIMIFTSEELEDEEQENFYSTCVSNIAESGLPGREKEEWIAKIETMAKKGTEIACINSLITLPSKIINLGLMPDPI
ncbi:MAG: hypothetical protein HXS54_00510 [Theionarchaea archaeon]|nr:hypothetical protein [Theionarchaea archaeon]